MTVKWFIVIFFLVILIFSVYLQIRNKSQKDTSVKIVSAVLDAILIFTAFAVPWVLPENIANTKIKYINGHVTIDQPAKADESTLAIEGFQLTGDSSKGTVNVKFHVTSNFYLLNGKLTVFRGNGLDPVIVGCSLPSSTCFSAHSATNFAIRFDEMESGKTYSGELVAEDISGKIVTKTAEFTAY